jgi:hypothetical protein
VKICEVSLTAGVSIDEKLLLSVLRAFCYRQYSKGGE